ncbi:MULTISPECIES: hypothetical protein [Neisseria]|uniref:Uncharacterized protein n=1 Tax=Neisseria musculi TaxID=1815583 RepID=A0A7H1M899_9NEIS|nr:MULTISPECIES: hypothetical protein [Neisseria]MBF0804935.1 hypothetical protein [Neisseria sp. 19428wB4_WF04]QNT57864.1 hypothetical protein H7A79_2193 [Neisseria musculi]TFU39351.1 hypothetical protein E4T99_11570 [Neisseria sp. WF04]
MTHRISDLLVSHYPCSAEFIADVLRWPLAEVKAELAKMERRGEIESRVLVTYRLSEEGENKCA